MTPRHFKCTQFREGTLDFSLECIKLLQNDFFKQLYITFNAIIPGQDRIYPNTHLCRTFFAGYTINKECERFCEFLINSHCCMMNGRNCQNNDFTFISTSGSSVIDFCVVPYDYLSNIQDLSVHPTSAIISVSNIHCTLVSPGTYPDHSLLVWTISVENTVMLNRDSTSRTASFEVFDRNIPTEFLDGQSEVLNTYISQI